MYIQINNNIYSRITHTVCNVQGKQNKQNKKDISKFGDFHTLLWKYTALPHRNHPV